MSLGITALGELERAVLKLVWLQGRTTAEAVRVPARAVKRIADWFCNGSVEEVLSGLVDAQILDRGELQRLADKIAKTRESAKGKGGPR